MKHSTVGRTHVEDGTLSARLIDGLPVPIGYLDTDLTVRACGHAAAVLLGKPVDEIIGQHVEAVLGPNSNLIPTLRAVTDTGAPQRLELEHRGEDGKLQHWELAFVPDKIGDSLAGIAVVGCNVTELTEAQHHVQEAEQAYRLIGELIPYGTWTAALDGSMTYLSESFVKMTGKEPSSLLGWGWIDLLETEEQRREEIEAWHSLNDRDMRDTKHRIRSRDGSYRSILCRGVRLRDDQGRPTKWAGIHVDITESERRLQFRDALAKVKDLLVTSLETDELLSRVGAELLGPTGADYAAIVEPSEDGWSVRYAAGMPGTILDLEQTSRRQRPLAVQSFESGEILVAADAQHDPRMNQRRAAEAGLHSLAILPIKRRGRPLCLLALAYTRSRIVADEPLMHFFSELLDSLDLALQAASVHEHQRHVAETLQQGLLTLPEHLPHVRLGHLYRAAMAEERVGGDFYDACEVAGSVAFLIGDVAGSGIEAAAMTALAKNAIRAHLIDGQSPGQALVKANRVLYQSTEAHEFVTVFVGVLDLASGEVTYASAGHPPPMLVSSSVTSLVVKSGLLLGALPEARYEDQVSRVAEGDILFLYTDGITEARSIKGLFGEERLVALLNELQETDPSRLVRRVFDRVNSYAEGRIDDDVAMLAIQPTSGS